MGLQTLDELRARIAILERRPPLAAGTPAELSGAPADLFAQLLKPQRGLLHEIHVPGRREAGAALGFALGLARNLVLPERQAILHLELSGEATETGVPYGPGLAGFGLDPDRLILGRLDRIADLLWAMEEAMACRAVAVVIADVPGTHRALDFTVSRRLAMRATEGGASALLIRYGPEREASAARLRWRIEPEPSAGQEFDARAPGARRFAVTLEKTRMGMAAQRLEGRSFLFDWVDHGFAAVERIGAARGGEGEPALSRAQPAALGYRLPQAG